jgi:competence protein ComGC
MSKIIRSKLFMVGMAVILVAGLVIGFTLPGLAKDNGKANPAGANAALVNIVTGNVTSLADDKSF